MCYTCMCCTRIGDVVQVLLAVVHRQRTQSCQYAFGQVGEHVQGGSDQVGGRYHQLIKKSSALWCQRWENTSVLSRRSN